MFKLILSAFAVSLWCLNQSAWGQTQRIDDFREVHVEDILDIENDELVDSQTQILPELKGSQLFTSPDHHEKMDWKVSEKEVVIDTPPLKGQGHSLIPWSIQDPEDFLNIDKWLAERSIKDKNPDWKIRLREYDQSENVGKILQCKGTCEVYRGSLPSKVQHLSQIIEGDELKTGPQSSAWVYLIDGSLLRLGANSSVSLVEFNLSKDTAYHFYRLNHGHVFWHPRTDKELVLESGPETDHFNLPLLMREANQANFERKIFNQQNDFERSHEVLNLEENAIKMQFAMLNELKQKNNKIGLLKSKMMLISPNASLISSGSTLDMIYRLGSKSYFKRRTNDEGSSLLLQMRGYSLKDLTEVNELKWYEVAENGRNFSLAENDLGHLEITELLTKRIKTFELAREIWIDKYTAPIFATIENKQNMAIKYGFKIWGEEISKRFDFMLEYMRRIETTNLKSIELLLSKNDIQVEKGPGTNHFQAALDSYLFGLKKRYSNERSQVREMSDLQYYVWILRNGK